MDKAAFLTLALSNRGRFAGIGGQGSSIDGNGLIAEIFEHNSTHDMLVVSESEYSPECSYRLRSAKKMALAGLSSTITKSTTRHGEADCTLIFNSHGQTHTNVCEERYELYCLKYKSNGVETAKRLGVDTPTIMLLPRRNDQANHFELASFTEVRVGGPPLLVAPSSSLHHGSGGGGTPVVQTHSGNVYSTGFGDTWHTVNAATAYHVAEHRPGTYTLIGDTAINSETSGESGSSTTLKPGLQQGALRNLQYRLGLLPASTARTYLERWQNNAVRQDASIPMTKHFKQPRHQDDAIWQASRGKAKAQVRNTDATERNVTGPGQAVAGDAMGGLMKPKSYDGQNYAHVWIDVHTRDVFVSTMGSYNSAEILHSFKKFCIERKIPVKTTGTHLYQTLRVHTDNWKGYRGIFEKTLLNLGVSVTYSSAYHHNTNNSSYVERVHGEVASRLRANLALGKENMQAAGMNPAAYWSAAIRLACLQLRLTPRKFLDGACTLEKAWGRSLTELDVQRLIPTHFGGVGYFKIQKGRRKGCLQFVDRRVKVLYLYTDSHGRHCCWDIDGRKEMSGVDIHWEHIDCVADQPYERLLSAANLKEDPDQIDWMDVAASKQHHGPHTDVPSALFKGVSDTETTPPPPPHNIALIEHAMGNADAEAHGEPFITAFDCDDSLPTRAFKDSMAHFNYALAAHVAAHTQDDVNSLRESVADSYAKHGPIAFIQRNDREVRGFSMSHESDWVGTIQVNDADPRSATHTNEHSDPGAHEMLDITEDGKYALMSDGHEEHVINVQKLEALLAGADSTGVHMLVTHDEQLKQFAADAKALEVLDYADLKITKQQAVPLPSSFDKAMKGPWAEYWKKSLLKERASFVPGETYKVVPITEWRGKIIRMHVVIDRRYHPVTGAIKSLKSRMVCNGASMVKGEDYEMAYASVPNSSTVRLLDAVCVKRSMIAMQSDVSCAFLAGELEPGQVGKLGVRPPKHLQTYTKDGIPEIWVLLKSVYGLVNASRCWQTSLNNFMLGIGDNAELQPLPLRRSEFDSSFYYLDADKLRTDDKYAALRMELVAEHGPDGIQFEGKPEPYRFYYCNHVDDSRLIGNSVVLMSAFSAAFASKYTVTGGDTNYNRDAAAADEYLKINIKYWPGDRSEWSQSVYIHKMLSRYGYDISSLKPCSLPMSKSAANDICASSCPATPEERDVVLKTLKDRKLVKPGVNWLEAVRQYRSVTAACNWLALTTMGVISFATSRLASIQHSPTVEGFIAMKKLLRFIAGRRDHVLTFRRGGDSSIVLYGESDASFGDQTHDNGHSQMAMALRIGENNAPFMWSSKRTPFVAISSFGSELMGLSECARSVHWAREILREMNFEQHDATTVFADSTSAISNSNARQNSSRTRSVRLRSWLIREYCEQGIIKVVHKPGTELAIDILTKALDDKDLFLKHEQSFSGAHHKQNITTYSD
jgi:hypothetical protein